MSTQDPFLPNWWEQPLYLDVENPRIYLDVARYPVWPDEAEAPPELDGGNGLPDGDGDGGLEPPAPKPPGVGWVWSMAQERWILRDSSQVRS